MSRGVSWFLLPTALFGFLALCMLLFIPMLLESSTFRPQLERWASHIIGRSVWIQGPVEFSLVPKIRVVLSGLHIQASQRSVQKDFLSVDSVEMEAPWGHILRTGFKPLFLSVHGLHMVLERDPENGFGPQETQTKGKKHRGSDSPEQGKTPSFGLGVPLLGLLPGMGLKISDADLLWLDSPNQRQGTIAGMSLSIGEPSLDGSQPVKAQGNVQGHPFLLEGSMQARKEEGTREKFLLIELGLQAGGRLKGSLKGRISSLERGPEAHLQVLVEPFSLQQLLTALGGDPKGTLLESWNRVSFHGDVVLSQSFFEVAQAEFRADDFLVRLSMAVGKSSQPGLVLNLETEELDLNSFFQPQAAPKAKEENSKTEGRKPKEHSKASAWPKFPDVPLLPLGGSASIHRVLLNSQALEDLQVSYRFWEGFLELEEIRAKLEGGELWGSGSVILNHPQPYVHFELNTREVQLGPVLKRLAGTLFLEGRMESRWDLQGPWEGDLDRAALSWKGQAEIRLKDGSINGVDLAKVSRSFGLAGKKEEQKKLRTRTPFSSLEAHLSLEDGSLKVSKASMQNKDLRILAAGRAQLSERSLDFRLEPELGSQDDEQKGATLVVPIWVNGTFSHPKFHPDLAGIRKKGEGKLQLSLPSAKDLKEVLRNLLKER